MTVREVIEAADRRKPNLYSREEKLRWLEEQNHWKKLW